MNTDPNDPIGRAFNIPSKPPVAVIPREVSRHDEFLYWLRQQLEVWQRPINGRDFTTDRSLGSAEGQKFAANQISKKLEEFRL